MQPRTHFLETTTLVLGYWRIDDNPKHDADHYLSLVGRTLELVAGARCLFFCNDKRFAEVVTRHAGANDITVIAREMAVAALPCFALSSDFVACCRAMEGTALFRDTALGAEKGLIHYWRHYRPARGNAYRDMLAIWLSKVPLMADTVLSDDPFGTERFAWLDISAARFNERRTNWYFPAVPMPSGKLAHYRSPMTFHGRALPLNASFMAADAAVWREMGDVYARHVETARHDAYAHDEETILALCHAERPELFHAIGAPLPPASRSTGNRPTLLSGLKRRLRRLIWL